MLRKLNAMCHVQTTRAVNFTFGDLSSERCVSDNLMSQQMTNRQMCEVYGTAMFVQY